MNGSREVIERITSRFEPGPGFQELTTLRDRRRTRRRVLAGGIALTMATGAALLVARAFPVGRAPGPSRTMVAATWPPSVLTTVSPASVAAARTDCPPPSGDDRAWTLSSTSGPAGSSVDVSGIFQNGQFWVQLWWNADGDQIADEVGPPPWPPTGPDIQVGPAGPGPVVKLASVAGPASGGECSYHARFTVPDVDPGTYQLVFVIGAVTEPPGEGGGYAVYQSTPGSVTFEVSR